MATQFAVIGGSKAYELLAEGTISGTRLGERKTPYGDSQAIYLLRVNSEEILFLSRHGEKGYEVSAPYVNYRANIYALKDMGVNKVVAWSGPGAISREFSVGDFVLVDDVIDETRGRPGTFFEGKGIGFIRQSPVFCPCLRQSLMNVLERLGLSYKDHGTYVCTQGPRLETPAEIRKFASYGGEMVGMTLVPEVFLARELEMCYAALCYVSNYAEGIIERPFRPGELFEGLSTEDDKKRMSKAVAELPKIIMELAAQEHRVSVPCSCPDSMQRYKVDGRIGEDWRDWLEM